MSRPSASGAFNILCHRYIKIQLERADVNGGDAYRDEVGYWGVQRGKALLLGKEGD